MDQLPYFWRTEIWHPLSVHFPIALLSVATVLFIIGYSVRKQNVTVMGKILLLLGTAGAWISVYTGSLADPIVTRELCDPTVLESHENGAYAVAWIFTIASALVIADYFQVFNKIRKLTQLVIIALLLTGSAFLGYTGHLGAKLVYQQAAGVYTPSEDCNEFEE